MNPELISPPVVLAFYDAHDKGIKALGLPIGTRLSTEQLVGVGRAALLEIMPYVLAAPGIGCVAWRLTGPNLEVNARQWRDGRPMSRDIDDAALKSNVIEYAYAGPPADTLLAPGRPL